VLSDFTNSRVGNVEDTDKLASTRIISQDSVACAVDICRFKAKRAAVRAQKDHIANQVPRHRGLGNAEARPEREIRGQISSRGILGNASHHCIIAAARTDGSQPI